MMKKFTYIVLLATTVFACKPKEHGAFTVSGNIANATSDKVLLEELPFGEKQRKVIDSATLKNGKFELRGMATEEGLYLLSVQNGPEILLVNDAKSIRVKLDVKKYKEYTTEGSKASTQLHELFNNYEDKFVQLRTAINTYDSLVVNNAKDSILTVTRLQKEKASEGLNALLVNFVDKTESPAACLQVVGMAERSMPIEEFEALATKAAEKFKENPNLQKFKKMVEGSKYALLGKPAPDFALPTANNDTIKLSSLRGKYVLVDFWASWCKPCRAENPNVVAAYNKYKDKNFAIVGVSLDKSKQDWLDAIAKDGLTWTHVSDLKQWESPIVPMYHIEGIPFNVLIDPNGKIIASGLRESALDKKLGEVLK